MRRRCMLFVLTGVMALLPAGCGEVKQQAASGQTEAVEQPQQAEDTKQPEAVLEEEAAEAEPEELETEELEAEEAPKEDVISFSDFKNLEFWFSSGAGGWATTLMIDESGGFSGEYFDGELGAMGEEYPNGTMYQANFSGRFTQPEKVNDYTYAMQIQEIVYEQEIGSEEIRDGMRYCYTTAYGLDGAEELLVYLPGAPLAELPEEFRGWVGYYDLSNTPDTELPFYALYNETGEEGFSSGDIVQNIKETISNTEQSAGALEESIENDPLSQAELNEKSQQMYEQWDDALNALWAVLKKTLAEDKMSELLLEQRTWIAEKEQTVSEAGAEYEGGSMQPLIENLKATELTKERVYELLDMLE